jgi:4,5-dihydroxyphthalate decarboxylase
MSSTRPPPPETPAAEPARSERTPPGEPPLALTFACSTYDRVLALRTGDVRPEGIDLTFRAIENPRQIFDRMGWNAEFDLAEFSSTEYITRVARGDRTFVALPVFPSRVFRHGYIFVNRRRIAQPKDLAGKRIGIVLYTQTAMLWVRGMLADEHGVDPDTITWVQGSMRAAGAHGNPNPPALLKPPRVEANTSARSLEELLDSGEIDAVAGTRVPACYGRNPDIVRLFPDFRAVESEYFKRTRIHPIMHLVAMKREVYDRHPWAAERLYDAFMAAKQHCYDMLNIEMAPRYVLPWLQADAEEMYRVFGPDPWPYGVTANRPTLEALMRYMVEQHYLARPLPLTDLFVGETDWKPPVAPRI